MKTVKVGFRDGFSQDEVLIAVDGKVLSRVQDVTTNPVISFAKEVKIDLPRFPATVRVDLPARHLSASAAVSDDTAYLAVFLQGGQLLLRPLTEDLPML